MEFSQAVIGSTLQGKIQQSIEAIRDLIDGARYSAENSHVTQDLEVLPCAIQSIPTPIPELNATKWKDLLVGLRQIFVSADDCRQAIYKYSIAHSTRYTLTSSIIDDVVRSNVEKKPNEIKADIYKDYSISLTCRQALRAKERALVEINGLPDQSYMLVPQLCNRLIETDVDTVAKWVASNNKRFECLFIAYSCSIKGFLLGVRPILYVDECFLSGPYRGTLLATSIYNADNELFSLAFAIVGSETHNDWTWFLQNIKDILGSLQVTIVSDRNNAIIGVVRAIFGGDRHVFCYRHVKENFSSKFKKVYRGMGRNNKEEVLKLLDHIAYARHEHEFCIAIGNLRMFSPQLARWVENQGDVDRWALSLFPF
ncbi:uncharacterized protein LOC129286470 [Prosopis cineraria]|uniref:uncharacterized protein LOC129286470 n=1 Tax=Prosopis cineraria TaxID=364024 RepID=UPI00240FBC75|nr:uncharacterized protein LOC129286470 [Prosopis cineraria]